MPPPTDQRFPFGRPVLPRPPSTAGPAQLFVLGAYPSALHVAWTPPAPFRRVRAIAIDNEPTPFWTGDDAERLVADWNRSIGWRAAWGAIAIPAGLNGPSGAWVEREILGALRVARRNACITDCLDAYFASADLAERLRDTYEPFAAQHGAPPASLAQHPSENEIVHTSCEQHLPRLLRELQAARPDTIVTLGNAALRVFRALPDLSFRPEPGPRLSPDAEKYGRPVEVELDGRTVRWLPLAHPAAPAPYQLAHQAWRERFRL